MHISYLGWCIYDRNIVPILKGSTNATSPDSQKKIFTGNLQLTQYKRHVQMGFWT